MHHVYILESEKNGRYYVGVTNNISRRIKEHNAGHVKSTAPHKPWEIKHIENHITASSAYQRERFIKSKHSRKAIEKIIRASAFEVPVTISKNNAPG